MHRPTLALFALWLAGCAPQEPLPKLSLKDPVPQPAAVRLVAAAPRADISVAAVVVSGGTDAENRRLALEMFHGLNLAGHDIKQNGAWRVTGRIEAATVTWTIISPAGTETGAIVQRSLTNPATQAIVPGVLTYLPRPSTRT